MHNKTTVSRHEGFPQVDGVAVVCVADGATAAPVLDARLMSGDAEVVREFGNEQFKAARLVDARQAYVRALELLVCHPFIHPSVHLFLNGVNAQMTDARRCAGRGGGGA